jgi:hypothetical protein
VSVDIYIQVPDVVKWKSCDTFNYVAASLFRCMSVALGSLHFASVINSLDRYSSVKEN